MADGDNFEFSSTSTTELGPFHPVGLGTVSTFSYGVFLFMRKIAIFFVFLFMFMFLFKLLAGRHDG